MQTLQEDINDFINNRIQAAYQEILDEPEFKTIRKDILALGDHIRRYIPSEFRDTFNEYCELVGQREAIMEETVYKRGFSDSAALHTHNPIK